MSRQLSINVTDVTERVWEFDSYRKFKRFIDDEYSYWFEKDKQVREVIERGNPHAYIANGLSYLRAAKEEVVGWGELVESWSADELNGRVAQLVQSSLRHFPANWLWSSHPFTDQFVSIHIEYGIEAATSYIDYLLRKSISSMNHFGHFNGTLAGYEFASPDSGVVSRTESEKMALSNLSQALESTHSELIGEVEKFEEEISSWVTDKKNDWNDWVISTSRENEGLQGARKGEFDDYMVACQEKISLLESTYEEKLRLEKPVKYWHDVARKLRLQGGFWVLVLIAGGAVGLYYLSDFFVLWLQGMQAPLSINSIQGVVIFTALLSVYAYMMRVFSRLAFSAFHLQRDAEERENLTHLFLAIQHGKEIDAESRRALFQALFSRSETGLLANETGPTMPLGDFAKSVRSR